MIANHKINNSRFIIDPVAFFAALIGGPVVFTAMTFWLLFIPIGALIFGGVPYLLLGTPVLLIYLRRRPAQISHIALLAFLSFAFAWLVLVTAAAFLSDESLMSFGLWLFLFGAVFSSCWGACFGWLYRMMARDFYTRPHTI